MTKHNNVQRIAIVLSFAIFFLIGCTTITKNNHSSHVDYADEQGVIIQKVTDPDLRFVFYENRGVPGFTAFAFGVTSSEIGEVDIYYGRIEVSSSETPLIAKLQHLSETDFEFVFKVFLNYEEIPFRILGEDEWRTEFFFSLESEYRIDIPFVVDIEFPADNYSYKLTAGIFVDPNRHEINKDNHASIFSTHGMVLNSELILGSGGEIRFDLPPETIPQERQEDFGVFRLFVTQEFELNEWGFVSYPDFITQVNRGEKIELSFYASPFTADYELENYLIIGMLNWQQIPLNGQPFLFVDAQNHGFENLLDFGTFTIDAIDEVGKHDLVLIIIENPKKPNTSINSFSINSFFPLEISNRLVIEVIE